MSEIKNGGLDQYGAEPFEQQQFGTAGVEAVTEFCDDDKVAQQVHAVSRTSILCRAQML